MLNAPCQTFDHGAIDPNTAALAMLIYHRGAGLAASAFGWLAAPQDLALLAETLRTTIKPDAPLELVRKHFVFGLCVEAYGRSVGPAEPRPGFGVMPAACEGAGRWWAYPTNLMPSVCFVQSGWLRRNSRCVGRAAVVQHVRTQSERLRYNFGFCCNAPSNWRGRAFVFAAH